MPDPIAFLPAKSYYYFPHRCTFLVSKGYLNHNLPAVTRREECPCFGDEEKGELSRRSTV